MKQFVYNKVGAVRLSITRRETFPHVFFKDFVYYLAKPVLRDVARYMYFRDIFLQTISFV